MKERHTKSDARILLYPDLPAKPAILLEPVTDARRDILMKCMYWYPVAKLAREKKTKQPKRSSAAKKIQVFTPNCTGLSLHNSC